MKDLQIKIYDSMYLIIMIFFLIVSCEQEDRSYPKQPKFAQLHSEIFQQDFALSYHSNEKIQSQISAKDDDLHNLFFLKQFSIYFSSFLSQANQFQSLTLEKTNAHQVEVIDHTDQSLDAFLSDQIIEQTLQTHDASSNQKSAQADAHLNAPALSSSSQDKANSLSNLNPPLISHYQTNPTDFEVAYDFSDHLDEAYVERNAMIIAPHMPGWRYLIEQTEANGLNSWLPPTFSQQYFVSWVQGLGATLRFHVSAEMAKQSLKTILIWVESVGTNQKISIFLDRNHLTNLSLKGKAQFYKIQLNQSLTAGEHQLRFWFKFAKNIDQKNIKNIKSPGAIGPIFINPKDEPIDLPQRWQDQTQHEKKLIFAGPPQQYSFYTIIPKDSILKFKPKVSAFRTITFEVSIENDQSQQTLYHQEIQSGEHSDILIPLSQYGNQAFKINFKTYTHFENASKIEDFEKSAWINPQLIKQKKNEQSLAKVQHLLIWQIEGLRWDLLYAALFHTQFHLPHLHAMFKSSLQSYDCWYQPITDTLKNPNFQEKLTANQTDLMWVDDLNEINQNIDHSNTDLNENLNFDPNANIDSQINTNTNNHPVTNTNNHSISSAENVTQQITSIRSEKQLKLLKKYQQQKYDHLPEIFKLLDGLDQKKNQSTLSFLSTSSFKLATLEQEELTLLPFLSYHRSLKAEDLSIYERQWLHYLLILKKIDYQLGVLRSTLSNLKLEKETAILLLGGGGYPMKFKEHEKIALKSQASLDQLYTPMMLYHPNLKLGNAVFLRGIEMQDVVKMISQSLGIQSDQGKPMNLGEWFQFQTNQNHIQIIDRLPSEQSSTINHQLYQRLGQMLLKKNTQEELLWNLEVDPFALKPMSSASPLMMRTMRHMIKTNE